MPKTEKPSRRLEWIELSRLREDVEAAQRQVFDEDQPDASLTGSKKELESREKTVIAQALDADNGAIAEEA